MLLTLQGAHCSVEKFSSPYQRACMAAASPAWEALPTAEKRSHQAFPSSPPLKYMQRQEAAWARGWHLSPHIGHAPPFFDTTQILSLATNTSALKATGGGLVAGEEGT